MGLLLVSGVICGRCLSRSRIWSFKSNFFDRQLFDDSAFWLPFGAILSAQKFKPGAVFGVISIVWADCMGVWSIIGDGWIFSPKEFLYEGLRGSGQALISDFGALFWISAVNLIPRCLFSSIITRWIIVDEATILSEWAGIASLMKAFWCWSALKLAGTKKFWTVYTGLFSPGLSYGSIDSSTPSW